MSNHITKLCDRLVLEAKKSTMTFKHASAIIENGKIISLSYNSNMRSRIGRTNMPSIHAEVSVLDKYLKASKCREKDYRVLWNQRKEEKY